MLRTTRIVSQIVFFALFCIVLFFVNTYPRPYTVPADLFLRLNPLVALLTEIAARTVIPSIIVLGGAVALLTIVFGRFFCGFVCPLGTVIDFSDAFVFKKTRALTRRPPLYLQRLKYVILIALVLLSLSGALFPLFMDPIALMTRIGTIVIHPLCALIGMESVATAGPLLGAFGLEKLQMATIKTPLFYGVSFTAALFLFIVAVGFWDRRFWCQYLCPSGALFGLLSRTPLFRRPAPASNCNACAACARLCPTRAIDMAKIERTRTAECVVCGLCTQIKDKCNGFAFAAPAPATIPGPDLKRRHLLFGIAGGALLAPIARATAINKSDGHGRLIRPPGAIPENEFLARCIACGNCMKACPTNALQPCMVGDGFNRLYTPKLVPRIGACDPKCHLCGYVCPTGAIRRISLEEKPYAKIGTAVVDRHRCLAWEQNKECLVCDEVCPFNAIEPRLVETTKGPFKVPVVSEDLCVGCGMCEMACPIFDKGAIEVYRFGENRLASGPYAGEYQKKRMDELRRKSDQDVISGQGKIEQNSGSLPPGFSE
jgi:MauM/NapG family ferredoxin protein